ncbi:unnamed protein product, partial [Nezara viridula]
MGSSRPGLRLDYANAGDGPQYRYNGGGHIMERNGRGLGYSCTGPNHLGVKVANGTAHCDLGALWRKGYSGLGESEPEKNSLRVSERKHFSLFFSFNGSMDYGKPSSL